MRILFLILLIANLAFLGVRSGYFGPIIDDGREPERIAAQVNPEGVKILAADADVRAVSLASAGGSTRVSACLEFGGFANDDVKRVEPLLAALSLGPRMSARHVDEQASFIVYLPPFKNKADADHAAGELRRIGVADFFVMQDNGPFKLAISLGVFHSEDAAKAQLTTLAQQGVRNAKIGQRPATLAKTYYAFRPVDGDLLARLTELKQQFPNEDLHDCAATPSVATSSSGT